MNLRAATSHGPARVIGHTWGTASSEDVLEVSPSTARGYDVLLAADVCWDGCVRDALSLASPTDLQLLACRSAQVGQRVARSSSRRPLSHLRRLSYGPQYPRSLVRYSRLSYRLTPASFERAEAKGLAIESIVEAEVAGITVETATWSGLERPWTPDRGEEPIEERNRWLVRAVLKWTKV